MTTSPTCARCGADVTPGARFCMKCGSDVSGEQGGASTAMMEPAIDENAIALELLKKATIGDYEILRELGRGGMAAVYLAHDIALDRKVAVKVMSPALMLMGEGMSERFKREARTAANLSHPNIIPIYAVKSSGKILFFVMKFIPGRSLESIIKELGPMPIPLVRALLQQVGSALGYAHRNGIVHRDVKPANIMIDEEGWAFVTDFGIAKAAENRGLTMTGIAVGTPSYMSPEQCAAKDITGKSDQYSLGVVAYEMLTGKQPFEGDSAMAIMFAHFHEAPKPVSDGRPDCPPELAAAVMRMLEKGPDKRWPTTEEALVALGAQPLAHEDPTRIELVKVVRAKSNRDILDSITPPPTSPVPPAKTRAVPDAATTPIPVAHVVGVTITPGTAQLHPEQTIQLVAKPQIAGGTEVGSRATWSSDTPATATVSETGLVTAVAVGAVTITAKVEGASGTAVISVRPFPVATVKLEPNSLSLIEGQTAQLKVSTIDARGHLLVGRSIAWSSALDAIARVSDAGLVTAVKAGTVELTAECEGVRGTIELAVAPPPVASITLAPTERKLIAGDSGALTATLLDASGKPLGDRPLLWSSSAAAIATVSPRGIVSGLTVGAAEILVRCEGKEARARVTVAPVPVASVTIAQPSPIMEGSEITLQAVIKDARGNLLTGRATAWTCPTPDLGRISATGVFKALKAGNARVTAECETKSWTVAVTVQPMPQSEVKTAEIPQAKVPKAAPVVASPVPVSPVAAPPVDASPVTATPVPASPAKGKLIGAAVALLVLAGAGYALTRRSPSDTPQTPADTAQVVLPAGPVAINSVEIQGETTPVAIGRIRQLAAVLKDAGGSEISGRETVWHSSDPAVATVSANGAVTAARAGTVTISAISEGKSDEFGLTVEAAADDTPPAVASLTLDGGGKALDIGATVQLAVRVKDSRGQAVTDRTVVWSSDDPRIAQVSGAGEVRAIGAGQTTISASSEGKTAATRITVKPASVVVTPPPAVVATPEPKPADAPKAELQVTIVPEYGPESGSLQPGGKLQLRAMARTGSGGWDDRKARWSSANSRLATVSSEGMVTAVAAGRVIIRAEVEGRTVADTLTIEAPAVAVLPPVAPAPAPVATPSSSAGAGALLPRRGSEAGGTIGCGIATGGAVCWGTGYTALTLIDGTAGASAVTVGRSHACALQSGRALCWGDNKQSQLGGANANSSSEAVAVSGEISFSSISAGSFHTCGISGSKVYCWGRGREGQLGEAGTSDRKRPVPVKSGVAFASVSAGGNHTCALTTAGKAYCWGDGFSGQLGFGGQDQQTEPIDVSGGVSFSSIAAGGKHTCAVTSAGKAYCWGANDAGQLGDGSKSDRAQPQAVAGGISFSAISAGASHSCGLAGSEVYCWGENKSGQVGDGTKSDRNKPTAVSTPFTFAAVSAGDGFSCGVTRSGETACWGRNDKGQLGDGGTDNRGIPAANR